MAYAFDTLGYAKRLRTAGVSNEQAEAHAEAVQEFIMTELVTKNDLLVVNSDLKLLRADLLATKSDLQSAIDTMSLRLTVRLGGLMVAGVGALALLQRLH